MALPRRKLIPLLEYLVPKELYKRLLFVWDMDICSSPKKQTLCLKSLKTMLTKCRSKDVCKEDQVFFMDDWPLRHMQNPEFSCIFPFSYMGQKGFERAPSRSIGNIATDLLPYLVPLILYAKVSKYVRDRVHIRQLHHLGDQD